MPEIRSALAVVALLGGALLVVLLGAWLLAWLHGRGCPVCGTVADRSRR